MTTKQQELVESNMRLVYFIVSREYPTYIHDEDIIQSGMLGLCKAAENWDETKAKFSTYAGKCIRNEIKQEFIKRKPHSKNKSLNTKVGEDGTLGDILVGNLDVDYVDDDFYTSLNCEEQEVMLLGNMGFSTNEIAKKFNWSVQKVRKILRVIRIKWGVYDGNRN